MNVRHLVAVSTVSEERGLRSAAKRLSVSQPTLSQSIMNVEKTCGISLFERSSSGMEPTQACDVLKLRIDRGLEFLEKADAIVMSGRVQSTEKRSDRPISRRTSSTQLKALHALVTHESYAGAAEDLSITVPSVHSAIRHLEAIAGVPLVERKGKFVEPTDAARMVSRYVGLAFAEFEYGFEEVSEFSGRPVNRLVVGSLPLGQSFLIPRSIEKLLEAEPDVQITLNGAPYPEQLSSLRHGNLDMIFGALRLPPPAKDVVEIPLFKDSLAIVGRPNHPVCQMAEPDAHSLADFPWIVSAKHTPSRDHFDRFFLQKIGRVPRAIIECSSTMAVREFLLASDRLCMISKRQLQRELADGQLVTVIDTVPGTERAIGLTLRSDWRPTRLRAEFIEILRETIRQHY